LAQRCAANTLPGDLQARVAGFTGSRVLQVRLQVYGADSLGFTGGLDYNKRS
jgi:hypothetical protein